MPTTSARALAHRHGAPSERAREVDSHTEASPRALVMFACAGLIIAAYYAVFFAWVGGVTGVMLALLGVGCAALAVGAILGASTRHTTAMAVGVMVVGAIALIPVVAALSTRSDAHLLWLALGFAMVAVIPEQLATFRALYGAAVVGAVLASEVFFRQAAAWRTLDIGAQEALAVSNRVWTVLVCACAMVVILVRSARIQRALHGVARHGERRANTDVLTSLANRRPVLDRLSELDESDAQYALVIIDVDNFKAINDKFGHDAGDRVIVDIAGRLTDHFGDDALVSRWGGDEFLVIVEDEPTVALILGLERLRRRVAAIPVQVADEEIAVRLSIGAARSLPGVPAGECLIAADGALYGAKKSGRNQVVMSTDVVGGNA